ncbi:hypothetical protein [Nosocomiicoccus massiliensis]|uniref:hypothetical protein n=1 Tax=Nosocomiicoccus massiliensis TaxID=1232430 RepID=UPI0003F5E88F|nr:hypothetical protein [Nosocomiicoccus massiliensis]
MNKKRNEEEYTDENTMTFNTEDVKALGEEMEAISEGQTASIDHTNHGADLEDKDLDKDENKK